MFNKTFILLMQVKCDILWPDEVPFFSPLLSSMYCFKLLNYLVTYEIISTVDLPTQKLSTHLSCVYENSNGKEHFF